MGNHTRRDGRVEPGQKITRAFSARAWNRAQEAADVVLGEQTRFGATSQPGSSAPYTWVYCKNESGVACPRWGVLEVDGMEIVPAGAGDAATVQFERMPVMVGVLPQGYAYRKQFVIAIEPIASNSIGRVAVDGVVQCKLNVTNESDRTANSTSGSTAELTTGVGGAAEILWKQPGTGSGKWGLVRLGDGGDPVRLCKTSAVWNRDTIATLNVWEAGTPPGETQSTGQTVDAVNKMHKVASGTWVIVARAVNGTWYLVEAGDNQSESCASPSIAGRDLTELPGYDAAKRQALTHDLGCLKWIDLEDCPA